MGSRNIAFSNQFERILFSIASNETKQLNQALELLQFSQYGIKIPVGYGFSLIIYPPYKVEEWCLNKCELFACDKLIQDGGSLITDLNWMETTLAHCIMYFNQEIGMVLIVQPDLGGLNQLVSQGIDTGDAATNMYQNIFNSEYGVLKENYGDRNYKELIKMQEFLANKLEQDFGIKFVPIVWPTMITYFNNWYYSGTIRRGNEK